MRRPPEWVIGHGLRAEPAAAEVLKDRISGGAQLYDLHHDPGETRNLAADRPEVLARLQSMMAAQIEANQALRRDLVLEPAGSVEMTEEEKKELEALGYAGGS